MKKAIIDFYRNSKSRGGILNQCKTCVLKAHVLYRKMNLSTIRNRAKELYPRYREAAIARAVKWNTENKERRKEIKKKWREANLPLVNHLRKNYIYREKGAEGSHSQEEYQIKLQIFHGKCAYCQVRQATSKDHVIPLSKGGSNYIDNIVPACISCNSSKGNKLLNK